MTQPERPTLVTAAAIVAILFGALGVLCSPVSVLPYFTSFGGPNPVVEVMRANPIAFAWSIFSIAIGFVLSIVLLAGGVGALKLMPWARMALIGYAAVSLPLGCIGMGVTVWAFVPLFQSLSSVNDPATFGGVVGGLFGGFCGIGFAVLLQGGLLFAMTRPNVKAAFESRR
jgi:hypothetical protein